MAKEQSARQDVREFPAGAFKMLLGDVSGVQALRGHRTEAWVAGQGVSEEVGFSYLVTTVLLFYGMSERKSRGGTGESLSLSLSFQSGISEPALMDSTSTRRG